MPPWRQTLRSSRTTSRSTSWTRNPKAISATCGPKTVRDGLGVAEDALAIGTAVNDTVAVSVHVLAGQPDDDSNEFDHVVEASFHTPSGRLIVMGCTDYLDDAARFDVPAGWTRARASRRNLAAAVRWLESDEAPEATEEIRLQTWPAPFSPPHIVKRCTQPEG